MIKTYHNSSCGRVSITLLLTMIVLGCWGTTAQAGVPCECSCDSSLINANHTPDASVDLMKCPPPVPNFCACPTEGCDSLEVYFFDCSQGYINKWAWDFGDPTSGANNYSSRENPSHWYKSPGTYTVTLTVIGYGGSITIVKNALINIETSPTADFVTSSKSSCAPALVSFEDRSTYADSWSWDFGDGSTSIEQNPSHTYTAAGTYNITLKVNNECGEDTITKAVTIIEGVQPLAAFTSDAVAGCAGTVINFIDQSTSASSWYWEFGDGTASTDQIPSHTYTAAGAYSVKLTVANECGQDDTTAVEYIHIAPAPVAAFTSDLTRSCIGATITFTDQSTDADSWYWEFGDGATSTDRNPTHIYSTAGIYSVSLTVSNSCGEDNMSRARYIAIDAPPVADFESNRYQICENSAVTFTDLSDNPDSWYWEFGDGTTSIEQNPTHTYTAAGDYDVTLKVSNACGEDTEYRHNYITVIGMPVADFYASDTLTCVGVTIGFVDNSQNATSWLWNFGDGHTSTQRIAPHNYSSPGTYTVSLTVSNGCGSDTKTRINYIRVMPQPQAAFTSDKTAGCEGSDISFIDQSSAADTWYWDFGDGTHSSAQNPTHAYSVAGTYTVTLIVSIYCGNDQMVRNNYISVFKPPVADFTSENRIICAGQSVSFIDQSQYATEWRWEFGDGSTSVEQNPTHIYNIAGHYSVRLTVTNACSDDTEYKMEYIAVDPKPRADFSAETRMSCAPFIVAFTDHSIDAVSWYWDFGDGTTSTDQNPTHEYTAIGSYTVTLTATNECGSDQATKPEYIRTYPKPTAAFTSSATGSCVGAQIDFTDLSTDAFSWSWDFGDGTTSTSQNPVHTYGAVGTYTVKLSVSNPCSSDESIKTDFIKILPPAEAAFSADIREGCPGLTVTFTDKSTDASSWNWSFGDGATSTAQNPSHTYTTAGNYSVRLAVTNICGQDDTLESNFIIIAPEPLAAFIAEITECCEGGTISFTDQSSYADSWHWDFGDGATSTEQNPVHMYSTAGKYTVKLTAVNDCGEDDSIRVQYITVLREPVAAFVSEITATCQGGAVVFSDGSSYATSWHWDFGDGATSIEQNPTHTYLAAGIYSVTLEVTNMCGDDEIQRSNYITVYNDPTAAFTTEVREGCVGTAIIFIDQSSNADQWHWDFGDGEGSADQNPTHTYATAGTYTVSLIVMNPCREDTAIKTEYITIKPKPTAAFSSEITRICEGGTIAFMDQSLFYPTSWQWDFGDGTTSNEQNPSHTYTAAGIYTVSLKATNDCGTDEVSLANYITIIKPPTANFSSDLAQICQGGTVIFIDQSIYAVSWHWEFGDGATSNEQNPGHSYTAAGTFTVTLTVNNECGSDSETKEEYINVHTGPKADFSGSPTSGKAPLTVSFTDLSTSALGINSWSWDFGDGATSNIANPSHVYSAAGIYTIMLTVSDDCGKDIATKTEYIDVNDSCSIDFSAEPLEGCAELTVYFGGFGYGSCEIESWTWNFGDPSSGSDNTGSGQSVQHIYKSSGKYTITLTAADISGQKVISKTDYISVYGIPTAAFSASATAGTAPLYVNFTDLSTAAYGGLSWKWDFGDPSTGTGNTSTLQNPGHVYYSEGIYTVSLIVTGDCGVDTAVADIAVSPPISITKAVDKPIASAGGELLYTLSIKNNSESDIWNIVVVDTIPDSAGFVDGSITGAGAYDASQDLVSWNIGILSPGTELSLSFKVILDGPFTKFPTIVFNKAMASIIDRPSKSASSQTFVSNTVETVVDVPTGVLDVIKEVDVTLASPGDQLIYTITVKNNNPAIAANVVLIDAIPDSTTYVDGSVTGGGIYYPVSDNLIWNLGSLNAFESRTVSFNVIVVTKVADGLKIPNSAYVRSSLGSGKSNEVITAVSLVPIVITKTAGRPSGMIGDLIPFTVTIQNYSDELFTNVQLVDTMPSGMFYVSGTSLLNGARIAEPSDGNPYSWSLGSLPASGTLTLKYTGLIGASAHPGTNDNIARAQAYQSEVLVHSNRALARIYILSSTLTGAIRGKVIVDCDGDGVADMDSVPSGMDVYLDDGSQSRVNTEGMFYFGTVRAGEHVVALDERDLQGYSLAEGVQPSVFVYVNESGESYVIFRICPAAPHFDIRKKASIVPTVKINKLAKLNSVPAADSMGVMIDYKIDIKSNGLADPTQVRVVDSFPENTRLVIDDKQPLIPKQSGNQLVYEVTAAQERMEKTVYYSLEDLTPGIRRFLTNKVHLEGDIVRTGGEINPVVSKPVEVAVGPFRLAPPQDVKITLTPALFITSLAYIQPPAIPQLHAVADSIDKYADANIKVEGHTDYRPIHTKEFPSNWELGTARAKAVVDWLVENRHIERNRLKYESFAATRPVVRIGKTSEELQPNRRTEVIIQAKISRLLDSAAFLPDQEWKNSTSMALKPVKFDTLFEPAPALMETGLDDSWEVVLTVANTSSIAAENAVITDILPDGVEYVANTVTVDGKSITPDVIGNKISLKLERIDPSQKLELRYRIRALEGHIPSGGGAASVEIKTSNNLSIVQKSNEVSFK